MRARVADEAVRPVASSKRSRCARVTAMALALTLFVMPSSVRGDGAESDRELRERVNVAIDRGVAWLQTRQRGDGVFPLSPHEGSAPLPEDFLERQWGGVLQPGADALCAFTLAECGDGTEQPCTDLALARLREHWDAHRGSNVGGVTTYFVSLCLLALDARHNGGVDQRFPGPATPQKTGRRLMGNEQFEWARDLSNWLVKAQAAGGGARKSESVDVGFSYRSPYVRGERHDHSCGQFAVLGLKAASRLGIRVPKDVWRREADHLLASQWPVGPEAEPVVARYGGEDGTNVRKTIPVGGTTDSVPARRFARGWSYLCLGARTGRQSEADVASGGPERATRNMTAAGVASLLVCRSEVSDVEDRELRERIDNGVLDGLAWLGRDLRAGAWPDRGPLPEGVPEATAEAARRALADATRDSAIGEDFYGLYALERACVLGGVYEIGGLDWWSVGARRLIRCQDESGRFLSSDATPWSGFAELDTCFALLFLKRSAFRERELPAVTPGTDR